MAALPADHPAVRNGTTLFPKSVRDGRSTPRVLVSGHNNPKLGAMVRKGPWRGMPIFHLTLVERETCPRSCVQWDTCMGNAMHLARRHRPDGTTMARLRGELWQHAGKNPQGFVVRLHTLGDFADVAYATEWLGWMHQLPQLHVFGYTAHHAESEIGKVVNLAGALYPHRWAIRFSVAPDDSPMPWQATTIWRQPEGTNVPEGLVCPAQSHRTASCGTCGLCWSPVVQRIVFVGHGLRRRAKAA